MKEYTQQELLQMLNASGLRASSNRIAILGYIAKSYSHPSVDDIYNALIGEYPTMSRATVYNTVKALADAHIIHEIDICDQCQRYDFAYRSDHAHFLCKGCGKIFDIPFDMNNLRTPAEFTTENVQLYFKGFCPNCKKS